MCLVDLRTEALDWIQVAMSGIAVHTFPAFIVSLLCMIVLIMQYGHYCHVEQIGCTYVWMCACVGAHVCECANLYIVWQLLNVAAAVMMCLLLCEFVLRVTPSSHNRT